MKRFILLHGNRHPGEMSVQDVQQFLSHLAVRHSSSGRCRNSSGTKTLVRR